MGCSTQRGASRFSAVATTFPHLYTVDDIKDGVASNIIIFADDTSIFRRV